MNWLRMCTVMTALAMALSAAAAEKNGVEPRTVSVNGEAEVKVVPDEVVFTLGIVAQDKDLLAVKRTSDQRMRDLLAVTAGAGIAAKDVQTDFLNIDREYQHESGGRRTFIGYIQRTTVVVTLRDIDKFEGFLTAVLQRGVEYVHGIEFRTSQLRKHRDAARALAIKAAREKATALAGELGETIGRPRSIQEAHTGWFSSYRSWGAHGARAMMAQNVIHEAAPGGSTESPVAPGQLSIRANVSVTFELR